MRLDEFLVKYKNIESRNKAVQLIENNCVMIKNKICNKKNYQLCEDDINNLIINQDLKYVSRAGYKLECATNNFKINFKNKIVMDVGASTGGFCDFCLQNGVKKVYCIDVGTNQLNDKIKKNPKVVNYEKTNIKDINQCMFNEPIDIVVNDISFISSKYMFEAIKKIKLSSDFNLITLIKPQFELNNEIVSKKQGYVDKKYHQLAIDNVIKYAVDNGFKVIDIIPSSILGAKKENQEYLM